MAITTLDPKTALILIDLQKGIVGMPTVHPGAEVVRRAANRGPTSTASACKRRPRVLRRTAGSAWAW